MKSGGEGDFRDRKFRIFFQESAGFGEAQFDEVLAQGAPRDISEGVTKMGFRNVHFFRHVTSRDVFAVQPAKDRFRSANQRFGRIKLNRQTPLFVKTVTQPLGYQLQQEEESVALSCFKFVR